MRPPVLHSWDVTPREAIALQRELAPLVRKDGAPGPSRVRYVAGADVAFDRASGRAVGAIVVLAYPDLDVVEQVSVETAVPFPYVPGLLSFRETPVLLAAFERLKTEPDVLFADGHGYAHPRRFGFACHLGLALDLPTLGVAKSRLCGTHGRLGVRRGSRTDLCDSGETIGSLVRTRDHVRPVYVSIGHRMSLADAEWWTLDCARRYRLPEPARLADALSRTAKRRMLDATLEVVIEQRAGEHGRWEWVREDDEVVFRHDLDPMPEHYGCSVEIINPGDGELLDVIVADDRPRARGERLHVRVVDILERSNNDHKLLAVPVDVPPFDRRVAARLKRARVAALAWFVTSRKNLNGGWAGEDRALETIASCREWTEAHQ